MRETCITFDEVVPAADFWTSKLDRLAASKLPFLVAELPDAGVVGYAYVDEWKPKRAYRFAVENSVYIDPAHTGRGLGRALMAELLSQSRAAGITQVIAVISDTGGAASLALHERFGFAPVGRLERVGYKFDEWIGVHLLQLSLA